MAVSSPPVLPPRGKKGVEFVSESKEYSLDEFVKKFEASLPEFVIIKQGFVGDIIEDTFDRDHVLRLCVVSRQTRILIRTNNDVYSIPISFSPPVCAIDKHGKASEDQPLYKILDSHSLPVTIQFPNDKNIAVGDDRKVATNNLPKMTLTKSFDEINLLGNFIANGVMDGSVVAVPLYLTQIRVSRIVGIQGDSDENWLRYQRHLNQESTSMEYDMVFGNPKIASYKGSSISGKPDFTYVQPNTYASPFQFLHDVRLKHMTPTPPVVSNEHVYDYVDIAETIAQHPQTERQCQATAPTTKHGQATTPTTKHDQATSQTTKHGQTTAPTTKYGQATAPTTKHGQATAPTTKHGQATGFSEELKSAVTRNLAPQVPPSLPKPIAPTTNPRRPDEAPKLTDRTTTMSSSLSASTSGKKSEHPYENDVPRLNVAPTVQDTLLPATASKQTSHEEKPITGTTDITNVENLTIEEVGAYLKVLKLHKYVEKFQDEMVDGSLLKMLDKSTLMEEFHLGRVEAIRLTNFAENGHVPK